MRITIPADWEVPEVFRQRLGERAGRQRAMTANNHLLLILHQPPIPGAPERTGRLFWRDAEGEWRSSGQGPGLQPLRQHVEEFGERIDELEEDWKSARSASDYFDLLRAVAPLQRSARNLHATLQQAREKIPEARELINLRDMAGDVERAAELLHHDAQNGLNFTVAHQSEQQAHRSYEMALSTHRLNLLVATFFPIATLSAIFSMNVPHGLSGTDEPSFFWGVLGVGFMAGLMLATLISRQPQRPQVYASRTKKQRK